MPQWLIDAFQKCERCLVPIEEVRNSREVGSIILDLPNEQIVVMFIGSENYYHDGVMMIRLDDAPLVSKEDLEQSGLDVKTFKPDRLYCRSKIELCDANNLYYVEEIEFEWGEEKITLSRQGSIYPGSMRVR